MAIVVNVPEDRRLQWPTHAEVAKRLGRSVSTIRRMRTDGALKAELVEGIHRFDPASIEDAKQSLPSDDIEDGAAALAESAKRGLEMALDYTQKLFDRYETSDAKKQEYIAKLEASNAAQREAAEKAMSEENSRELARKQIEHGMALKERTIKSLTELGLPLIAHKLGQQMGFKSAPQSTPTEKTNGQTKLPDGSPIGGSPVDIPDAAKVVIADMAIEALGITTPESFAKLKEIFPQHFEMFASLYERVKA